MQVQPTSQPTFIVRRDKSEAFGDKAAYVIDALQPDRFTGDDLGDYLAISTWFGPLRASEPSGPG